MSYRALYKFAVCKEVLSIEHFIVVYTANPSIIIQKLRNICHEFHLTLSFFVKKYMFFLEKLNICLDNQIRDLRVNFFSNVYIVRGKQPLSSFFMCYKKLLKVVDFCDYSFICDFAVNKSIINFNSCWKFLKLNNVNNTIMVVDIYKFCVFYAFFFKVLLKFILKIMFYPIFIGVCQQ